MQHGSMSFKHELIGRVTLAVQETTAFCVEACTLAEQPVRDPIHGLRDCFHSPVHERVACIDHVKLLWPLCLSVQPVSWLYRIYYGFFCVKEEKRACQFLGDAL